MAALRRRQATLAAVAGTTAALGSIGTVQAEELPAVGGGAPTAQAEGVEKQAEGSDPMERPLSRPPPETFQYAKIPRNGCMDCGGEGLTLCVTCKGTGQFSMIGSAVGNPVYQYQYVDCPDCNGLGQKLCQKCSGTGLPNKYLKGFMRDPAFRKVVQQITTTGLTIENLPLLQQKAREAVVEVEKRKAAQAAAQAGIEAPSS